MIRMYSRPVSPIFNSLFEDMLNVKEAHSCRRTPAANILETDKTFEISLVVPGIRKNDIQINLEKDVLSVKYEAPESNEEKNYTRQEFEASSFCRSFILPDSVEKDKISARHENGILNIELPKKEAEVKVQREIAIA